MGFEDAIGAQAPLGTRHHPISFWGNIILLNFDVLVGFWDPLGLLKDADQERFDRLRTVETKHGRIAQLAILGHLVTSAGIRKSLMVSPSPL